MADLNTLSAAFPPASAADWRALVAKTLGEKPFESLQRRTPEGLLVEPLYTDENTPPAAQIATRPFDAERPWDLRVASAHPDPARANSDLVKDLQGGAASILLKIDPTGKTGSAIGSAEDLARALDGVLLEVAPVALDAGFLGIKAAEWLNAFAKASPGALPLFHMDPLSAFAASGSSPGPIADHVDASAALGVRLMDTYPQAGIFLASGQVVHEAGGGEAGELAFALSAALSYARALTAAGASPADAFGRITLGLAADADYFLTIAKLRAARLIWARITEASGCAQPARIECRSSQRMLAKRDPWTNMLRLTSAGFGAAVGGADAIVLGAYTDALGSPTAFARRQSRNTQLVLMEEAHIGRVLDPAAGSGYVEALTDAFARTAWSRLQAIEAAGGLAKALEAGLVAADVSAANSAREAEGQPKIVGVTAFPPAEEAAVEVETPEARPSASQPSAAVPGADSTCPALAPIRIAAPYEAA